MKSIIALAILLLQTIITPTLTLTKTRKNMFGTDGIRATIGMAPLTAPDLHRMGYALGAWIVQRYGEHATVLIGHDTRLSCAFVKSTLKSGLLAHPVYLIDAEELPTPAVVQLAMYHEKIDCGIIISASHNPFQDNGIKLIDGTKGKLSAEHEQEITELFETCDLTYRYDQPGQERYWGLAKQAYADRICSFFPTDILQGKKIVLDCANGAAYELAPTIFRRLGAEVITFAAEPNGKNINVACGAVHPESLQKLVLDHHADAGFAFDGDADRVIAINAAGQVKDGDDIIALLLDHPRYNNMETVVGTVMSNKGFEVWLNAKNRSLIRTPVGDKYIAQALRKEKLLIGGEQSGHIILADYLPTGDGIFTALRIMESCILNNNIGMKTFNHFPQQLINVYVKQKQDLSSEPFATIVRTYEQKLLNGRLLVRYSGTEPLLRIMVEDSTAEHALKIAQDLAAEIKTALDA